MPRASPSLVAEESREGIALMRWLFGVLLAIVLSLVSYLWSLHHAEFVTLRSEHRALARQVARLSSSIDRRLLWHEHALEQLKAPGFVPMAPEAYEEME